MNHDMKEMVASWHSRLGRQIKTCRVARDKINRVKRPEQAAMLAGKTKAYVEMQNYLESKYRSHMPELLEKRRAERL